MPKRTDGSSDGSGDHRPGFEDPGDGGADVRLTSRNREDSISIRIDETGVGPKPEENPFDQDQPTEADVSPEFIQRALAGIRRGADQGREDDTQIQPGIEPQRNGDASPSPRNGDSRRRHPNEPWPENRNGEGRGRSANSDFGEQFEGTWGPPIGESTRGSRGAPASPPPFDGSVTSEPPPLPPPQPAPSPVAAEPPPPSPPPQASPTLPPQVEEKSRVAVAKLLDDADLAAPPPKALSGSIPQPVPTGEPVARLVIEQGSHRGQVFGLHEGPRVLGRGKGCDLRLIDDAVSRKHLELRVETHGVFAKDLGTGNGTKVNGRRIFSETKLQHGDLIELGRHQLRFDDVRELARRAAAPALSVAPPSPVVEPGPQTMAMLVVAKKKWIIALGTALVAILLVVVFVRLGLTNRADHERKRAQKIEKLKKDTDDQLEVGVEALRKKKYAQAFQILDAAVKTAHEAKFDIEPRYKVAFEDAKKEAAAEKAIAQARTLLKDGFFAEARKQARSIAKGSEFAGQAAKLVEEIDQAELEWLEKKATAAEQEGRNADAKAAYDQMKRLPGGTAKAKPEAEAEAAGETARSPVEKTEKPAAKSTPAKGKPSPASKAEVAEAKQVKPAKATSTEAPAASEAPASAKQALAPVLARFDSGKVAEALDLVKKTASASNPAVRAYATKLERQITQFSAAWDKGSGALRNHNGPIAARELENAYGVARDISPNGPAIERVRSDLARAHYLAAGVYYEATPRDLRAARKHYARSFELDPDSKAGSYAQQMIDRIDQHIARVLQDASAEGDPADRKRRLEEVVSITEPGSESHKKAQELLKQADSGE